MRNETVVLLAPLKDNSTHRVCRQSPYWGFGHPWVPYWYEPLRRLFARVVVYDYIERMLAVGLKTVNKELINIVRNEHPKYVFWPAVHYEFLESTFHTLRKEGAILVGFFFDDEFRFDNFSKYWIPYLDYCITSDVEVVPKYVELGARVLYAFVCLNSPIDVDWSNIKEKYDVSFVGSNKFDREQYINEIRQRGISVHLAGIGWDDGAWIPWNEMINIFRSSKINLNFTRTEGKKPGWKARILEVVNAGGFLLTEYRPTIEEYFDIGKEIVCFRNADEMIDKITYYLNHEEERRAIAKAGWTKGTSQYTPFHMMSSIIAEIEADFAGRVKPEIPGPHSTRIPMEMRKGFSEYYSNWGLAFLTENYRDLWRDAFALSIRYYPWNRQTWYRYILGLLPYSVRLFVVKLRMALYSELARIPYLRKIKQTLTKRFHS